MNALDFLDKNNIPQHVSIIMDGNGRWAKKRGNPRIFGHKNGVKAVRETVEAAGETGVKYLTLYAFSTENWNRPKAEVDALMSLLVNSIENETENLIKNKVRLQTIGCRESLPDNVNRKLDAIIANTSNGTGLTLILALSYSSKFEIIEAVKKIANKVAAGNLSDEQIDEKLISDYLQTASFPDPDLMIRTSGEYRLSNFLLWQSAYSELYFTPVLWPDFRKHDFFEAILDYQKRERRFGKTGDQIETK